VKYVKKNLESFSLYRRKNYHDPLSSLFVAEFLMFHGIMNNPVFWIICFFWHTNTLSHLTVLLCYHFHT